MENKICVVTGATSGIGLEMAREITHKGAHMVLVGRDREKTEATVAQFRTESGNHKVEYLLADLSIQAEVRHLAEAFKMRHDRLDVLINNAGAVFLRRQESADGIEMTWALNHLSYFLLTNLLLNRLKASQRARVVNIASASHRRGQIHFEDVELKKGYGMMRAYRQSKLANVMFTYELARRLERTPVTTNAVHPEFVATNIGRNNGWLVRLFVPLIFQGALSPAEGAKTGVYVATAPELEGVTGKYFVQKKAAPSSSDSYKEEAAQRLWTLSEKMTGFA